MDHKLYLSDKGIYCINNNFYYHRNKQRVTDTKMLNVLSSIAVPPAWTNVWYASNMNCHIQVYGTDTGNKKQYILSQKWIKQAKFEKFQRMKRFIKNIACFKRKITLRNTQNFTLETIIHLLFNLLIDLHIRVGNEIYAQTNQTYGLTTLRQRHLKFNNGKFELKFIGKSNIEHSIEVPVEYNEWFYKLISKSRNKPLFQFNGTMVTSEDLNEYLKNNMGAGYTCKDFRTYSANMLFITSFLKRSKSGGNKKRCVLASIDDSAQQLGHTRSISRKSYISETLVDYCINHFDDASASSPSLLLSKVWS